MEFGAHRGRAFAHRDEPESLTLARFGIEADAVVLNREPQNPAVGEGDPDDVRMAMPRGVRHRLANDPQELFLVSGSDPRCRFGHDDDTRSESLTNLLC